MAVLAILKTDILLSFIECEKLLHNCDIFFLSSPSFLLLAFPCLRFLYLYPPIHPLPFLSVCQQLH